MKKRILLFVVFACFIVVSCDKKPVPEPDIPEVTVGAFVLNNGNFGSNDASLTFYNPDTKTPTYGVFQSLNGKKLGDTAQDMFIYGSKIYIAVFNSGVIFVTDRSGKLIGEIKAEKRSPRYFTAYNGNLYVTYYEGYLGKIDTTSLSLMSTVKVGDNPENVEVANGKLYVANSGGMNYPNYGKTVSVVNPSTMSVIKTLDVVDNPTYLAADSKGDVYLISIGNYNDVPSALQKIDTQSDVVATISNVQANWMSMGANDKLYIISSQYDANWNTVSEYYVYDAISESVIGKFITDGTAVEKAYSISADPVSGNVYIGTSDYKSNGDMYVFSAAGVKIDKFDTGGLNPIGVYFVTNK
ncbi:MAG: hypothetical protein PHD11_00120 [Bacteroidales bacterium]|nr:hypothetical protein [Bacteroidales bacterium]MDD4670573.1 hypothetical protein [Bacteroidales bacterium]